LAAELVLGGYALIAWLMVPKKIELREVGEPTRLRRWRVHLIGFVVAAVLAAFFGWVFTGHHI
jgi:predicted Na+-dependent transporter